MEMAQAAKHKIPESRGNGAIVGNVSAAAKLDMMGCALPEECCNFHVVHFQPNAVPLVGEHGAKVPQELAEPTMIHRPGYSGGVAATTPAVDASGVFAGSDLDQTVCQAKEEDLTTEDWLDVTEALLMKATAEDGTRVEQPLLDHRSGMYGNTKPPSAP